MADMLQEKFGTDDWKDSKFKWIIASVAFSTTDGQKVPILLLKPTTFMNLSGESVASMVHFYKLNPQTDILIIADDIDMEFGKVRYRGKWSSWGQNGLKSIITHLGTDEFCRIKIGIGRDERFAVSDWVLSSFWKEEQEVLKEKIYLEVLTKIEEWINN